MKKEVKRVDTKYVIRYQQNQNDLEAFNTIYEFYRNALYYFSISYVRKAADAEEIVQETFIKVIRYIKSLQSPEAFHAWLYRICYSTIMLHYRKDKKYQDVDDEFNLEEVQDGSDTPKETFDKQEIYQEIDESIEELGSRFETVARLYYFDEFKIKEISEILEIPEGTVKTRLMKIKVKLKEQLESKGVTPNKYLSLGFTPFMYNFFQSMYQQATMNEVHSQTILTNLHNEIALVGAPAILSGGLSKTSGAIGKKIVVSLTAASLVTVGYFYFTGEENIINSISYPTAMTRKNIEVQVSLNKEVESNMIEIKNDNKEVAFELDQDSLIFVIDENGNYEITIDDERETLTITNIDCNAPVINSIDVQEDKIYLALQDELSGIDFETSYAVYKDEKIEINDGYIYGTFDNDVYIYLYDKVGNNTEYRINIGETSI